MQRPLEILAIDLPIPASLEARIEALARGLESACGPITHCRVTLEGPGRRHRWGRYKVGLDVAAPRRRFRVHGPADGDLPQMIRRAFCAARRRLLKRRR